MGQKVHPLGFRLGIYRWWPSRWFARREKYSTLVLEDIKIRRFIETSLPNAEISSIEIERAGENVKIVIHSARVGAVIGKKGQEIENLRRNLSKLIKRDNIEVSVQEVKQPELDAVIVAKNIAEQIEKRASYKKIMKRAAASIIKSGAKGVKIRCAGRLAGAEIARDEWIRVGSTPLHTLRSDIDYGFEEAHTTYGVIGVKVWICRGEYKLT